MIPSLLGRPRNVKTRKGGFGFRRKKYYLCIGQRRKPRAAAGFLLFFGPFRGSQRAFSRQTAGYVGKTKCLVVLRKSFVFFSKCFPRKTTKPRDCFRRLKTLKFDPTYLWKTTPRKATAGGARTAPPVPSRGRHEEAPPTPEHPPQRVAGK